MHAFVINLERSTARHKFMKQQLDKQGVVFETVKAVDGAELSDEYLSQICDFEQLAKSPHLLRKGVYGCLLSHYSICQRIVSENLPCALVLEDDITLQPGLGLLLAAIEAVIKPGEVVLLFSQNNYMPTVFSSQSAERLVADYQLAYPLDPWALGSAGAYIITQAAAQGLLKFLLPIRHAADTWGAFYDSRAITSVRCVIPFPARPAGFKSDIDYVSSTSIQGRVLSFINKHEVFPFKQLLDYRRRKLLNKTTDYQLISEVSRVKAADISNT